MATTKTPALDKYLEGLTAYLPRFSPDEQRAAVSLYRELAKGHAVDAAQLGRALGISSVEARELLERDSIKAFVYPDDQGRVLGFGGLAATAMHHRFEVDGRRLSTWCAWDSLFIPEILGQRARVTSPDPETGQPARLIVGHTGSKPPSRRVPSSRSLLPDAHDFDTSATNVMAKSCHFVFFFASRVSGEGWVAKHPGTFLYSLAEGGSTRGTLAGSWRGAHQSFGIALSAWDSRPDSPMMGFSLLKERNKHPCTMKRSARRGSPLRRERWPRRCLRSGVSWPQPPAACRCFRLWSLQGRQPPVVPQFGVMRTGHSSARSRFC